MHAPDASIVMAILAVLSSLIFWWRQVLRILAAGSPAVLPPLTDDHGGRLRAVLPVIREPARHEPLLPAGVGT